jgi:hypothetical protein
MILSGGNNEREGRSREENERASTRHEDSEAVCLGAELPGRSRQDQVSELLQ